MALTTELPLGQEEDGGEFVCSVMCLFDRSLFINTLSQKSLLRVLPHYKWQELAFHAVVVH